MTIPLLDHVPGFTHRDGSCAQRMVGILYLHTSLPPDLHLFTQGHRTFAPCLHISCLLHADWIVRIVFVYGCFQTLLDSRESSRRQRPAESTQSRRLCPEPGTQSPLG